MFVINHLHKLYQCNGQHHFPQSSASPNHLVHVSTSGELVRENRVFFEKSQFQGLILQLLVVRCILYVFAEFYIQAGFSEQFQMFLYRQKVGELLNDELVKFD